MRFLILLMLISALLMPACGSAAAEVTGPTAEPGGPAANANNLPNTQWVLESFGQPGAETPVIAGSNITLTFEENNQAGGSGGCNSYGGQYQAQGNSLSFSEIVSTLMACADENVTQQEQDYLQALQGANRFELNGDQLTIWYNGDQGVLNFVRASS